MRKREGPVREYLRGWGIDPDSTVWWKGMIAGEQLELELWPKKRMRPQSTRRRHVREN